jgi:ribokinase
VKEKIVSQPKTPTGRRPIVVIGSINMDLVIRVPRLPQAGETVLGTSFAVIPGGKGANQAVAAARLGGEVHLIGRVGQDDFGRQLLAGLRANGVNAGRVVSTPGVSSGCAAIAVDDAGENSIAVVPGANGLLSPADVDAAEELIASAAVVVMQLEVPMETVRHAAALCRRVGVATILDPAPVPPGGLPGELYDVDILTPNESEAAALIGWNGDAAPEAISARLLERGCQAVVLKLGAAGSLVGERSGPIMRLAPYTVTVVDTTAAGDAFTAALAVGLAEGMPLAETARLGNAAGALCCTRLGAQPALPTRQAVEELRLRPTDE